MTTIEVVIVEDDTRIAEINSRFTKKVDGFEVLAIATTGEQALELLELVQPQLVLLDVYLPDIQGTDLVKRIRELNPDMDIIMITAAAEVEIVGQSLRNGVSDYIVKPVTFERFKRSLENYRNKLEKLKQNDSLSQDQIESLWYNPMLERQSIEENDAPKGIDPLTLNKILKYLPNISESGVTADMFSKEYGVSRSTARRYLEYLISQKKIYADLVYGNVGRPERRYFRSES